MVVGLIILGVITVSSFPSSFISVTLDKLGNQDCQAGVRYVEITIVYFREIRIIGMLIPKPTTGRRKNER